MERSARSVARGSDGATDRRPAAADVDRDERSTSSRIGDWLVALRRCLGSSCLPTIVFFVGWAIFPIVRVAWFSLSITGRSRLTGRSPSSGSQNYVEAFADPLMQQGLLRAAQFTALFFPGMIFIPMFLAVLIDRVTNPRVATFYRLVLLIPAMIPGPLIFLLWKWMYDGYIGPINYVLVDVFGIFHDSDPATVDEQPARDSLRWRSWSGGGVLATTPCSSWPAWRRFRATSSMPRGSTAPTSGRCSGPSRSGACCRSRWSWSSCASAPRWRSSTNT